MVAEEAGGLKGRPIARPGDHAAIDIVAGHEHAMVARLATHLGPHANEMTIGPFGILIAARGG